MGPPSMPQPPAMPTDPTQMAQMAQMQMAGMAGMAMPGMMPNAWEGQTFIGVVNRKVGESGFIECPELTESFGRDVYMWKTYFKDAGVGDTVQFRIHVNDKGFPQVRWLEKIGAGVKRGAFQTDAMKQPRLG